VKASTELLRTLRNMSQQLSELSRTPETFELDTDAIVDLNLARESIDKLINRLERLIQ
jgi:hypothetical protein